MEYLQAADQRSDEFAEEISSASHDAISCDHDREYRGYTLPFRDLANRNNISLRVSHMRRREEGGYIHTVNVFLREEKDMMETLLIGLIAYKNHTRWTKTCEVDPGVDIRDWENDFDRHIRRSRAAVWKAEVEDETRMPSERISPLG